MNRYEHKALQVLLAENRPMYGLDIVSRSNGVLKRGTVYVVLGRLEDRGLVESEQVVEAGNGGLIPRRQYTFTTDGARAYWKSPMPSLKRWWQFWQ